MYSVDKSNIKKILTDFHKQIRESRKIYEKSEVKLKNKKIRNIVYFGMGGSAMAGDLLSDVFFDELNVPINVVRSYFSPSFCNENTLIIASSYSGNTEETISAVNHAIDKGAQIAVIASGGRLAEMAEENKWSLIKIPEGLPPRLALGYLFFPLYHLLGSFELIKKYKKDLGNLARFVQNIAQHNEYPSKFGKVFSKDLARSIQNRIPVFYSTTPYLTTASRRWKNQMQESGKSPAFANVLPEMNHNEIVGWEIDNFDVTKFIVIFLENEHAHPRIKKRIELSKEIIKKRGVQVIDIYSSGLTAMEKVFSVIVLGDWVSYYLALAYKKDPAEIKNIDYLKEKMALETGN